jgi:menaquinone-specific isochorismate synthase
MAVAIRCGLVKGKRAIVFAGAGIVAGSDPDAEWNETEDKMRPYLQALGGADS